MAKKLKLPAFKPPDIKSLIFGKPLAFDSAVDEAGGIVPVKDIRDGIIITRDNRYIKVLEVLPVNFYLKSAIEQQNIIHYFASYLKIAPPNLQIIVQTGKADIDAYCDNMQRLYENEPNVNCRHMIWENAELVNYLAANEAITHRFFFAFEHENNGVTSYEAIVQSLNDHIFRREIIRANAPAEIMYIADSGLTAMITAYINSAPAKIKEDTAFSADFGQAVNLFSSPVYFIPADDCGKNQLYIMLAENYNEKIARYMLPVSYRPPDNDLIDARFGDDGSLIVLIDFNVKRLEKALRLTDNLHVLVLEEQMPALKVLLNGRGAEIYSIKAKEAFEILGIPPPVDLRLEQFTNEKGVGVIAERFVKRKSSLLHYRDVLPCRNWFNRICCNNVLPVYEKRILPYIWL